LSQLHEHIGIEFESYEHIEQCGKIDDDITRKIYEPICIAIGICVAIGICIAVRVSIRIRFGFEERVAISIRRRDWIRWIVHRQ